jgi:hypothetical protein
VNGTEIIGSGAFFMALILIVGMAKVRSDIQKMQKTIASLKSEIDRLKSAEVK